MKKLLIACLAAFSVFAHASSEGIDWDKAPNKSNDLAALQNGAKIFVNHCLSCHSAAFMRYNRLADLGLTEKQIKDNLMFATDRVGETMKSATDPKQAKDWFGGNPPDLTLIARSRSDGAKGTGADYLYTLLRSYYRDDTKATGWNNLAYPNIGMPHILWEMQGERKPVMQKVMAHGVEVEAFKSWEQVKPGAMTPLQYDTAIGDLVAYLSWMGEPAQNQRTRIGVWVLLFLMIFTGIAWRLNAAYWKDIK